MKNFKKLFQIGLVTMGLLISLKNSNAQSISNHFFGENAWMPYAIGSSVINGKLDQHWGDIKNMLTNAQYISMIDSIRANGMEPIIQVPFNNNEFTRYCSGRIHIKCAGWE